MKKTRKILEIIINIIWSLFILLPLLTIILGSFKSEQEFYNSAAYTLPEQLFLGNYFAAINLNLAQSLITTFSLITLTVIFSSIFSCGVAFVFERFKFKFKKKIMLLFWITSLIPLAVMQIFIFQVLNKLQLYNTISGMVLLYSVSDIVIINIFREYISKIPQTVDKSARVSGANYWQIFWKIILPNMKPAIMVVTIYKMMQIYNDFYLQFLYLPTKKTLSTYLYTFISPYSINWPMICATVVLLIIPVVVILILLQWENNKIIKQIN